MPEADVAFVFVGASLCPGGLDPLEGKILLGDSRNLLAMFPKRKKADLYRLADACVMPSQGEGFDFAFPETLASGIPAVGSRTDGGREALREGLPGVLVDPKNCGEIEHAVIRALDRSKGSVPDRLAYYSFDNFVARLNHVATATVNGASS